MSAPLTVDEVVQTLGYDVAEGLVTRDAAGGLPADRRQVWREASERLGVEAAYFEGAAPLVYFRGLALPDESEIQREIEVLHRKAWNHARAPFFVIVLPNEVRVLDLLAAPFEDYLLFSADREQALSGALDAVSVASVRSGGMAAQVRLTSRTTVVQQLRADLRKTLRGLTSAGLPLDDATALLARSLFVEYLDHRGFLEGLGLSEPGRDFDDHLAAGPMEVYGLFDRVYERFNGDVFPVSASEVEAVELPHLISVLAFLRGHAQHEGLLFPLYDFSAIPAEVLSTVYEELLGSTRRRNAAFYTPELMVDLALDQCFAGLGPDDGQVLRVLDPACGSGVFLSRAFRRIAERRMEILPGPSAQELSALLKSSVFGCDVVEGAVRVAAFGCLLVLLDHCSVDDIADDFKFPSLIGSNFYVGDFFAQRDLLEGERFEIIVSNPPWKGLTTPAKAFIDEHELPVGSNQIAQAFFWASTALLAPRGRMAVLMPAKVLYNDASTNIAFRERMVRDSGLDLIVDFSAFRRQLFSGATAPMALLVTRGADEGVRSTLTFCTPHPSKLGEAAQRYVLSGDEIKRLPRQAAADRPWYLKANVLGRRGDADLFERLSSTFAPLASLAERGWRTNVGYQLLGGDEHPSPELNRLPKVESRDVRPFQLLRLGPPPESPTFHRPRDPAIFQAPLVLVARNVSPARGVQAAFSSESVCYTDSVIGLAGPTGADDQARVLCALLNSSLVRYLLFLTATGLGVERPRIEAQDLNRLPLVLPEAGSATEVSLRNLASMAADGEDTPALRSELDEVVFDLYGLRPRERGLVLDLLATEVDLHQRGIRSSALERPSAVELERYVAVVTARLEASFGIAVEGRAFDDGKAYASVAFGLGSGPPEVAPHVELRAQDFEDLTSDGSLVLRRSAVFYGETTIALAKPAEIRQWTGSAASQDAETLIADCLQSLAPAN